MIPVNNSTKHNPRMGRFGDCFSACLSSILETAVPHVLHDGCDGEQKLRRLDAFLKPLCLSYVEIPIRERNVWDALDWGGYITAENGIHYLLLGNTKDDTGHYVVAHKNEIAHNPNEKAQIVKPIDDFYWIGFVTRRT